MTRANPNLLLISALILGACAPLSAQAGSDTSSNRAKTIEVPREVDAAAAGHMKELPVPALLPNGVPFSIESHHADGARSIRFLSPEEMSREDRDLAANAESSIQERAGFQNMEFEGEGWTYRELVCTALPKHMFLRFTRDDGTRQMSMFTAAIPRDGNGRVHVIPIARKGYSLFSPAPVGALTVAAFNRIRAEEGAGTPPDWLDTALCYAALAGANPQLGEATIKDDKEISATFPPTLAITAQGGAIIGFADMAAMPKPMEWTMTFDPRGKLLKASRSPAYVEHVEKYTPTVEDAGQSKP